MGAAENEVNLAAQAFSSSVADAIQYCTNVLNLPQFQGSEATVQFIRLFDHLFDILNTRNPCATGFKAALRVKNKSSWDPFLDKAYNYIEGLKGVLQNPMHTTKRKLALLVFFLPSKASKVCSMIWLNKHKHQ